MVAPCVPSSFSAPRLQERRCRVFCVQDSAGRASSRVLLPPQHLPVPSLLSRPRQPSPNTPG